MKMMIMLIDNLEESPTMKNQKLRKKIPN